MSGMITRWNRFLRIAMGSAMSSAIAFWANYALAQISPDSTLPNNSIVTPDGSSLNISGGTQAGGNLFHSFQQFSVPTGGAAIFNNAADIQNIIGRVTGGSVSNIDGIIGTNGAANLFLINPSGIIFGRNASLNIGGSFVASTASSFKFANGTEFSAVSPQAMPLLTVSVPVGLQYGVNPGSILNQSQAIDSSGQIVGLQVQPGKTLALVGGDVNLNDGILQARGGRVELGGLSGEGTVGLSVEGNDVRLSFPNEIARSDVLLYTSKNKVINPLDIYIYRGFDAIDVIGGGSAVIHARNLQSNSNINAGETSSLSEFKLVGHIVINATGEVSLINAKLKAMGRSGAIYIQAGSISSKNSILTVSDFGGVAGTISISADDSISAVNSSFMSLAGFGESSGNINIQARSLSLTDGSSVSVSATGGVAGNINIRVTDSVNISGSGLGAEGGYAFSGGDNSPAMGGNINIKAGSLTLSDFAGIGTQLFGKGASGNVTIQVDNSVSLSGYSDISTSSSGQGNGGDIAIKGRSLSVDNSLLSAEATNQGNAGNILVETLDSVTISGGFKPNVSEYELSYNGYNGLSTSTQGSGRGGDITIRTGELRMLNGGVLNATTKGNSNGGNIRVDANTLEIADVGQILTTTFSSGNAGNIIINASNSITLSGRQNAFDYYLKLYKDVYGLDESVAKLIAEDSINYRINSSNVSFTGLFAKYLKLYKDDYGLEESVAQLNAVYSTLYIIDSSNDYIINSSNVSFTSGLFASSAKNSTGQGGDLKITTGQLVVQNGAQLTVSNEGKGNAGNLEISARSINLDNQAELTAQTASGKGGNITLQNLDLLLMRRGSKISTTAGTAQQLGDGGNITINAPSGFIIAASRENSDITANAFSGSGGRVIINATGIYGIAPLTRQDLKRLRPNDLNPSQLITSDITAISQITPNLSGTVTINTPNIDPNGDLINLPSVPLDTKVSQVCQRSTAQNKSSFIITGRGGLPLNPREAFNNSDTVRVDWVTLNPSNDNRHRQTVTIKPTTAIPEPIVEATGWVLNEKGEVVLTANALTTTPHSPWSNPASCTTNRS